MKRSRSYHLRRYANAPDLLMFGGNDSSSDYSHHCMPYRLQRPGNSHSRESTNRLSRPYRKMDDRDKSSFNALSYAAKHNPGHAVCASGCSSIPISCINSPT